MIDYKVICCVAGISGGHLLPCLYFAKKQTVSPSSPLIFISTATALDKKILTQFPDITDHLELHVRNVPYRTWYKLPLFACSFAKAIWNSFWYLKKKKPTCIITTGGFVAVPVCLAAFTLRIPIVLFELNVLPGKAINFLQYLATTIFICFPETQNYIKKPCTVTSYPLRFTEDDKKLSQPASKELLRVAPDKKMLLILGGSQGSEFLNTVVQKIPLATLKNYFIVHQTGAKQVVECENFYAQQGIAATVFAYRDDLAPYYQAADTIICRAGAGTLFEALFFEKRTVVIPLETAITDHQLDNARALEKQYPHLFCTLRQQDLIKNPELLVQKL